MTTVQLNIHAVCLNWRITSLTESCRTHMALINIYHFSTEDSGIVWPGREQYDIVNRTL